MDTTTQEIIERYQQTESRLLIDDEADWIVKTVKIQAAEIRELKKKLERERMAKFTAPVEETK
jgi:hypothetical protein